MSHAAHQPTESETEFAPADPLPRPALARLATRLHGDLGAPGEEAYEKARAGFQTARQHRPQLAVRARTSEDVQRTVAFAAAHQLPVAVQGTGHATRATATNGGVLLDTRPLEEVTVDAGSRTARIAAGTPWSRVVEAAGKRELAPLSGSAPHVGAVSYTLGGGLGLLSRRFGYAADRVRALDVVTPDGAARRVTPKAHPDLFWALRGGRDNFGVVTGMEVELFPVQRLQGGGLFFAPELIPEVLDTYLRWAPELPEEAGSSLALVSFPDVQALPEQLRGRRVAHVRVAFWMSAGEAAHLLRPLRAVGPRLQDTVAEIPYTASGSIYNDPTQPSPYECENVLLGAVDHAFAAATAAVAGADAELPHVLEIRQLGGRMSRSPSVPNAVGHREASFLLVAVSRLDRAPEASIRRAHRRLLDATAPWQHGGRFLNFLYGRDAGELVSSAYEPADWARLRELKAAYDPGNLFRLNLNIPPAVAHGPAT